MLEHGAHRIEVNGVELSIEISGHGPPLLFTTPGWGVNIDGYRGLEPLEERFTVIWTETRGTGKSTAPADDDYRVSTFTADAEALRRALGIERWWIAGHSWGGVLAQDYIAHHPDRCLGAILLCTMLAGDPGNFDDILLRGMARAGDPGCNEALEAFPRQPTTDAEASALVADIMPLYFTDLETSNRFLEEHDTVSCRVAAMVAEQPHNTDRTVVDLLPAIDVPIVVVAATHDFVCSPPKNQRVHHLIPGSKFVLIEESGHFPWFEQPEQFWTLLDQALSAVES